MITSYVEESPTKKSMTLEIPAEDVARETDKNARALARKIQLPGFRRGKVPVDLVKKRFAEEIKGEVIEMLVQDAVAAALKEKELVPLGRPHVEDLKLEPGAPLSFRVDLEVRPKVSPTEYRGLKVPAESTDPTAEEVDRLLQRIREGHATYEPIEGRPAADGDFALVDIRGSFPQGDGKDFEAEKVLIEIGAPDTMPEMSGNLRNAEPGSAVTFQKDFPAEAHDPDFAGKTVLYNVSLVALKQRVLPPMDDELARTALASREGDAPEGAGLDMLREKVKQSLAREKEAALREKKRRAVLDGLLALNPVDAPDSMVEAEIDSALREYARHLSRQGVDLKQAEIDWNKLRGEAREGAVRRVKEYLLLDAVGEAEKVEVTDTELDAEIRRRAQGASTSFAELKKMLVKADRLETMREEMRIDKTLDFLIAESITAA